MYQVAAPTPVRIIGGSLEASLWSQVVGDTYEREPGFVWRLAHDRVLLRRVGARDPHAMTEVQGDAMLLWVALDEPGTAAEVAERLAADTQVVRSALAEAQRAGLVRVRQTMPPGVNDHG